jgi:hypothetical protein
MGSHLRRLHKDYESKTLEDSKFLRGYGRLADKEIDNLQNYYIMAIRSNAGTTQKRRQDVWAKFCHKKWTNKPRHRLCTKGELSLS